MKGKAWDQRERKFVLPKHTRFDTNMLPVVQNLTAMGLTERDIGVIVGFQGKNSNDWLNELKRHNIDVKEACRIGKQMADGMLVAQMYKTAIGYEYEEVEEDYKTIQDPSDPDKTKTVKVGEKRKIKHQPGNPQMQMFIAVNHMPEFYKNRIETTKKGFMINADVEVSGEQIEQLAGALMKESKKIKHVDSKVIEGTANVEPE